MCVYVLLYGTFRCRREQCFAYINLSFLSCLTKEFLIYWLQTITPLQSAVLFFLCRFNFLDKSVGFSTLFDITSDSPADEASQLVETSRPLHIPGLEGLVIPSNTRGRILRVIGENTVLVRWEVSDIIILWKLFIKKTPRMLYFFYGFTDSWNTFSFTSIRYPA